MDLNKLLTHLSTSYIKPKKLSQNINTLLRKSPLSDKHAHTILMTGLSSKVENESLYIAIKAKEQAKEQAKGWNTNTDLKLESYLISQALDKNVLDSVILIILCNTQTVCMNLFVDSF